ncbi:gamma-glutamyl-gamma-aminobutyrate hydrolase family protein [Hydrogenimonas sp.]
MGRTVVVTGSTRGSRIAWNASRFLLRLFGVRARFFHPGSWEEGADMDGLLVLGGIDIDPATYGGTEHPSIAKSDPARDAMELALLARADAEGLPVMGICRGMQLLNLFYGGTLHPHIHDLELNHPHPHTPLPLRFVTVEPRTRLHAIVGAPKLRVNALHHQAVDALGEGLRKAASDANGITQAIEGVDSRFVLGLQWHPEFMPYAWHSRKLFAAFAEAAKAVRKVA